MKEIEQGHQQNQYPGYHRSPYHRTKQSPIPAPISHRMSFHRKACIMHPMRLFAAIKPLIELLRSKTLTQQRIRKGTDNGITGIILDDSFRIVEGKHIQMLHKSNTVVLWNILNHCLNGINRSTGTWSRIRRSVQPAHQYQLFSYRLANIPIYPACHALTHDQ